MCEQGEAVIFVGVFVDVLMNGFSIFMDVNGIKRIYLLYL